MARINQLLSNLEQASAIYKGACSEKKVIKHIIEAKKLAYIKASLRLDRQKISGIITLIDEKLSSHYKGESPYCVGTPSQAVLKLIYYRYKLESALEKAEYPTTYHYQSHQIEKAIKKGLKKGLVMHYEMSILAML